MAPEPTLYDRLGVTPDSDASALRAAYRRRARELHPDLRDGPDAAAQLEMALVNEAWGVLSNPERRSDYDRALARRPLEAPQPVVRPPAPRPPSPVTFTRREAWLDGIRLQIRRLGTQAGRSTAQALLLRHPGTRRQDFEAEIPLIVAELLADTADRVREARSAGAAPLDLANGAALLGLWSMARKVDAQAKASASATAGDVLARRAEMIDRMFDTMAHELPRELVRALGDNPRVSRRLRNRR